MRLFKIHPYSLDYFQFPRAMYKYKYNIMERNPLSNKGGMLILKRMMWLWLVVIQNGIWSLITEIQEYKVCIPNH